MAVPVSHCRRARVCVPRTEEPIRLTDELILSNRMRARVAQPKPTRYKHLLSIIFLAEASAVERPYPHAVRNVPIESFPTGTFFSVRRGRFLGK